MQSDVLGPIASTKGPGAALKLCPQGRRSGLEPEPQSTALSFCQCRAMVSGSRGHRVLQKHTVIASQQGGCDLGVRATEHLALPEPARGPWTAARRAAGHVWGEVGPLAGVGAGREIGTRVPEREAMRARVGRNPAEGLEWPRRHYTDVK